MIEGVIAYFIAAAFGAAIKQKPRKRRPARPVRRGRPQAYRPQVQVYRMGDRNRPYDAPVSVALVDGTRIVLQPSIRR